MAALAKNRDGDVYRPSGGVIKDFPVAVDIIYKFAMVSINAAGYLAPSSDTANEFFCGIALDEVDNSAGSAGDKSCRVDCGAGAQIKVTHEDGSMAQGNVGDAVVCELDNEVTSAGTGTNDITCGRIAEIVDATTVWVMTDGFAA